MALRSAPIRPQGRFDAGLIAALFLSALASHCAVHGRAGLLLAGAALLALGLSWIAVIDARRRVIPNALSYPLIAAGLAFALARGDGAVMHFAGAALGFAVFWAIDAVHVRRTGRTGLGRGDAKLMAAGGAWLGVMALPFVALAASLAGLGFAALRRDRGRGEGIAFGPALAAAIWLVWLGGNILPFG